MTFHLIAKPQIKQKAKHLWQPTSYIKHAKRSIKILFYLTSLTCENSAVIFNLYCIIIFCRDEFVRLISVGQKFIIILSSDKDFGFPLKLERKESKS